MAHICIGNVWKYPPTAGVRDVLRIEGDQEGDTNFQLHDAHFGVLAKSLEKSGIFNMAAAKPWFYTIRKHRKKSIAAALFAGWLTNYGVNKYR